MMYTTSDDPSQRLISPKRRTDGSFLQSPWFARVAIALVIIVVVIAVGVAAYLFWPKAGNHDFQYLCPASLLNATTDATANSTDNSTRPIVFVISMDGFSNDYIEQFASEIPNIMRFIKNGTRAVLRDATPTLTFPMHYTLATGLYTESHGIVGNNMYDPVFNAFFSLSNGQALNGSWWGGDPIWNVVQRAGLRSGVYFWPGSEAEINGMRPNHYTPFNDSAPNIPRITQIFEWIDAGECDLCMLYYSDVDHAGHEYGAGSQQVLNSLIQMDQLVAIMTSEIQARQEQRPITMIIVSDHGMVNISTKLQLPNYINNTQTPYYWVEAGALTNVRVYNPTDIDIIYNQLITANLPAKIYKKDQIPVDYHYGNNRRVFDIVIEANEGVFIGGGMNPTSLRATHGYNSILDSMQAIFLANGPAFTQGTFVNDPLNNVDVFSIIAKILNVPEPKVTNGSLQTIQPYLCV